MNAVQAEQIKTYRVTRKVCFDDEWYEAEREQCKRELAAKNGSADDAPEKFCYCRELVVNGERVPMPKFHDCQYVAAHTALIEEAERLAMKKCGYPTEDKNLGLRWTGCSIDAWRS